MSKRKTKPKKKQINIKASYTIQIPPPSKISQCPRCGEAHEKTEPQKFLKPMEFFGAWDLEGKPVLTARSSHWQLCPTTKEPIIFYDRFLTGPDAIEEYVKNNIVESVAQQEDQKFLAEIRAMYENAEATNKPPLPDEIRVELLETKDKKSKTKTWAWVYDPNAPTRMVKGTKKEAAEQRARVRAQEAKAKPLVEKDRARRRKELDEGLPRKKK